MAIHHEHGAELRHQLDDNLDAIRLGLVELGSLVVANTRRAGEALTENDISLIDVVRQADGEINTLYRSLEHDTLEILALQQPVATDLRFLVAATRMLYEIERSGDLAVNIVNALARTDGIPDQSGLRPLLGRLSNESAALFAAAIDAVGDVDVDLAYTIDERDDVVDRLTGDLFTAINTHKEELGLENAIQLSRVGRYLERIADHGVNIAEHVVFVVTGSFPGDETPES